MLLCGLNRPRATNSPCSVTSATSAPGAGSAATRAIVPEKTQGCLAKNGCARRGLRTTFGKDSRQSDTAVQPVEKKDSPHYQRLLRFLSALLLAFDFILLFRPFFVCAVRFLVI